MHYNAFERLDLVTLQYRIGEEIEKEMHYYNVESENDLDEFEREEYLRKRQITGLKLSQYDGSPSFDFSDDYKGLRSVPFTPTLYGQLWQHAFRKENYSVMQQMGYTPPSLQRVIDYQKKYGAVELIRRNGKNTYTLPTYEEAHAWYDKLPLIDWPLPSKKRKQRVPTQLERRAAEQLDSLLPRTPEIEKKELVTGWLEQFDRVADIKRSRRQAKLKRNKLAARRSLDDALENARKRNVARKLELHKLHYRASSQSEEAVIVIEDVSDTETIDLTCSEVVDWGDVADEDLVIAYEQAMGESTDPERYDYNPWGNFEPNVVVLPHDFVGSQPTDPWAFAPPPSDDSELAIASRVHLYPNYSVVDEEIVCKLPTLDKWLRKQ